SDRIGGRIHTIKSGPQSHLDLGAQWVHGEVGNKIYETAKSRDLLSDFLSVDGKGAFYTENGDQIKDNIVEDVMNVLADAERELYKLTDASENLSVGEFLKKRFFEYLANCQGEHPETLKLKLALYEWYIRWQRVDNACNSLHSLSARCWGHYVFPEGNENMNPRQGFSTIVDALLDEVNAEVILGCEVI
ncbi:hypothetical protein SK128_023928, partial [Halocaridina rubra]